jgi:hypothetical protein
MFAAGIAEGNLATAVSSASWSIGALLTALLPSHSAEAKVVAPQEKPHKRKTSRYRQKPQAPHKPPPVKYRRGKAPQIRG